MSNSKLKVAVLDLKLGNIGSVKNILSYLNANFKITNQKDDINNSDALIIVGIGSFCEAMYNLHELKLQNTIENFLLKKKVLAICLGMQILFTESEEFQLTKGINFFNGKITRFLNEKNLVIPHMMWNDIRFNDNCYQNNLIKKINNKKMYFTHSYMLKDNNIEDCKIFSKTRYGNQDFISSFFYNNIICTQFHPELSGKLGLNIYKYFLEIEDKHNL